MARKRWHIAEHFHSARDLSFNRILSRILFAGWLSYNTAMSILRAFAIIVVLSAAALGQTPPNRTFNLVPLESSPAARQATENLSIKRQAVIKAQQNLDKVTIQTQASPAAPPPPALADAQKKVEEAATQAKQAESQVLDRPKSPPAPANKIAELVAAVNQIKLQALKDASVAGDTVVVLTVSGILLALGASVSGFLKKAVIAGILSLSAAAVGGVPKATAIDEKADFYQTLYQSASSLAYDLQFALVITEDDYNEFVQRFQVLVARSAPEATKSRQAASDLISELQAVKMPHTQ